MTLSFFSVCQLFFLSLELFHFSFQDFHYPLFMTLVHITIIFSLSAVTRRILQSWTGKPRVLLNWTDYLHRVAPTGMSTAFPRLSRVFPIEMSLGKKNKTSQIRRSTRRHRLHIHAEAPLAKRCHSAGGIRSH